MACLLSLEFIVCLQVLCGIGFLGPFHRGNDILKGERPESILVKGTSRKICQRCDLLAARVFLITGHHDVAHLAKEARPLQISHRLHQGVRDDGRDIAPRKPAVEFWVIRG